MLNQLIMAVFFLFPFSFLGLNKLDLLGFFFLFFLAYALIYNKIEGNQLRGKKLGNVTQTLKIIRNNCSVLDLNA